MSTTTRNAVIDMYQLMRDFYNNFSNKDKNKILNDSLTSLEDEGTNNKDSEDEDSLADMHNKAATLAELGSLEESFLLYDKCLKERTFLLGDENLQTMSTMHNMAEVLASLGYHQKALTLYEDCLEKRHRIIGDEDTNTLTTMHNMACTLQNLGHHKKAVFLFEECLERRRRTLQNEDTNTLSTVNQMAYSLNQLGRHEEALAAFEEVLEKRRRVLGNNHLNTLHTVLGKASTLVDLGLHDEGLSLMDQCIEHPLCKLEAGNIYKVGVMFNKAVALQKLKRAEDAVLLLDDCIELCHSLVGDFHIRVLALLLQHKTLTLSDCGRNEDALATCNLCEEKLQCVYNVGHRSRIKTMSLKAKLLKKLNQPQEALALYAVCICKERVLKNIVCESYTIQNISQNLEVLGRSKEAERLKEALQAKPVRKDNKLLEAKDYLKSNASILIFLGFLKKSCEMCQEALNTHLKHLGENHKTTITTLMQIVDTLVDLDLHEEAVECYIELYERSRVVLENERMS